MTRRPLIAALAATLLLSAPANGQRLSSGAVDALQHWMDAVENHRAGLRDEWLEPIVRLTYRDRSALDPAMSAFLAFFGGTAAHQRTADPGAVQQRALDLARSLDRRGESVLFLKRAAILHMDAAISGVVSGISTIRRNRPAPSMSRTHALSSGRQCRRPCWTTGSWSCRATDR